MQKKDEEFAFVLPFIYNSHALILQKCSFVTNFFRNFDFVELT